jgi:hypothetical protein
VRSDSVPPSSTWGKALKLKPDDAIAHALLEVVRMFSNRAVQGIAQS